MDGNLGLALIRDGNGTGAFDALLRYRGTALHELWRALRLLKALQAQALHDAAGAVPARIADRRAADVPNEPGARGNPGEIVSAAAQTNPAPLFVTAGRRG